MKIIRIKPVRKSRTRKQKRIIVLMTVLALLYLSTFVWGGAHPYRAGAVQLFSAGWLMLICGVNGWLRVDV